MDEGAVKKIAELGAQAAAPIVIEGVSYVRDGEGNVVDPRQPEPLPQILTVYTLTSLVEYLKDGQLEDLEHPVLLHVGPQVVRVMSALFGRFEQRAIYLDAKADPFVTPFAFRQYMTLEDMVIGLQTGFVATAQLAAVLKVVGNVTDENVKNASDDGMTQTVTARAGIVSKAEVQVPNPVTLKPYRTFAEVEQPDGTFILRMRQGGTVPMAALFPVDSEVWKLKAIESIKAWLKKADVGYPVIG